VFRLARGNRSSPILSGLHPGPARDSPAGGSLSRCSRHSYLPARASRRAKRTCLPLRRAATLLCAIPAPLTRST
jgi:hypothetical protein